MLKPPQNRFLSNNKKEYKYNVSKINEKDVTHLNTVMIMQAKRIFGCSDLSEIKKSVMAIYNEIPEKVDFIVSHYK